MFWAVTCHFNPAAYGRKIVNFRTFRRRLEIPLLAVELSFDGRFELTPDDADLVVQIRATDVMWQKERLLNVGIARLPSDCEYVAWLDADVVFGRQGWAGAAVESLQKYRLCQPFQSVVHLPPGSDGEPAERATALHRFESFAYAHAAKLRIEPVQSNGLFSNPFRPGHAWCARRGLLARHGIYDRNILGGGDGALAYSATGRIDVFSAYHDMPAGHAEDFRRWGQGFAREVSGSVGFLEGDLLHLWHGDLVDRQYRARRRILLDFDYDPATDIEADASGCWRWASPKYEMHRRIREYFFERHEDGRTAAGSTGGLPDQGHTVPERKIEDL